MGAAGPRQPSSIGDNAGSPHAIYCIPAQEERTVNKPDAELDCVGLYCPMPIARTKEEIDKLEDGQLLLVEADDPAAEEDIKSWAKRTGNALIDFRKDGPVMIFLIRKGG